MEVLYPPFSQTGEFASSQFPLLRMYRGAAQNKVLADSGSELFAKSCWLTLSFVVNLSGAYSIDFGLFVTAPVDCAEADWVATVVRFEVMRKRRNRL